MTRTEKSRLEGIIYLFTVLTGLFSLMYVPRQLIFIRDIESTIINIQDNIILFGLAILSELLCYIAFFTLPIALYRHFEFHNHQIAVIRVGLVMIAVPISCFAVSNKVEILEFLNDANFQSERLQEIMYLKLKSYYGAIKTASIFWGFWLIPFGYLGYVSNKIPKALCVLLIIGGIGYQINFVGHILVPEFKETIIPKIAKIPSTIGEIGTCLWLLIVGIEKPK